MSERLPQNQLKCLAWLAKPQGLKPGYTGDETPFTGFGEYQKPDDNPWAAAALYRKGLVDRVEAMETDRYRGANTSERYRFFWVYRINDAGRAALAAAAEGGDRRAPGEAPQSGGDSRNAHPGDSK